MSSGAAAAPSPGSRWAGPLAWGLVLALVLLRLGLAAAVELGDDEAYYWTWADRPTAPSFDHPPLVGWLEALARGVLGDGPGAARLPFTLCALGTGGLVWAWTRRLAGPGAAALALVLSQVVPVFALGAVFVAPDGPALLATAAAGLAVDHALRGGRGGRGGWALAGLAVGLGLWAKLTVALVPLSVLGLMAVDPALRRSRGPWLAAGVALALWAPWWAIQAGAGWPTLRFHLVGRHGGGGGGLAGLGTFLGGNLVYASPVLAGVTLPALRALGRGEGTRRWVVALALPPLVLFTAASLVTEARPHWAAAGWLAALPAVAAWLAVRPRWALATVLPAALLTGLLHAQALHPLLPLGPQDPTHDPHGWATAVRALQARHPEATCLVAGRYQVAAHLRRHADPPLPVLRQGGRDDQYTLRGDVLDEGCAAPLFLDTDRYPSWEKRCTRVDEAPLLRDGVAVRTLRAWRCPPADRGGG